MMERHVLTTLNFGLSVPTVYTCLLQASAALSIPSYLTSKAEIFLSDVVLTCCGMERNTTRIATSVLLFCVKSFLERSVDSILVCRSFKINFAPCLKEFYSKKFTLNCWPCEHLGSMMLGCLELY